MEIFRSSVPPRPAATERQIADAESALGHRLPAVYRRLLRQQNGGCLARRCFATNFVSSWAEDHIAVEELLGVGGAEFAIDGDVGSAYMVSEWGYPDIGLVMFLTPSAGHDTVMLDYTDCGVDGEHGEPSVAYVDEDRVARQLAPSLDAFLGALVDDDACRFEE